MAKAKVLFSLEALEIVIDCSTEEKMRDICQRCATKMETNLETLSFLYGEKPVNLKKKLKIKLILRIKKPMK